ncbi:FliG C-terminal domain-containing protein [Bdellovibrio bacteriovorus]|uniref:FliG C-terminal domain-containing protein n=1 Tax=Bdellovibrio bacteriovorus TaxID=959 RepID=UPI003AA8F4EA
MMKRFSAFILSLMFSQVSFAQYIEEIGSLETVYEARARSVLNTILRPTDYTLVVAIEMDRDEKKLKEFHDEMDVQYLPGMPLMGDAPTLGKATNKLHEMKSKTDISVVLSRNVNPETEKVIKELLTSKLHLDATAGDSVTVKRIELPADPPKAEPKPDILPELTWKMWTLIVIMSLLALSGLMFWAWRRGRAQDPRKEMKENHEYKHTEKDQDGEEKPEEVVAAVAAEPAVAAVVEPQFNMDAVKQHILAIAAQYPQLASRAVTEFTLNESAGDASLLMEFLGWDTSKRVFTDVPAMAWARLGKAVKEREGNTTKSESETAVRNVYKAILAAYVEHEMSSDETNPFSFVLKMREEERQQILDKETPANIAVLCLHSPAEVTAGIVGSLDAEKRVKVLAEISRVEKLPHNVVQAVISSFNQKLTEMRMRPEPKVEGASVLAKVIRGMSPEEEMDLLALFANDNPEELERLRRVILTFDDLKLVPSDILSEVLNGYEVDSLYAALFKTHSAFYNRILATLPERKAMIVERDLTDMVAIPQRKKTAEVRRDICQQVEKVMYSRSLRVGDLVDGTVRAVRSV